MTALDADPFRPLPRTWRIVCACLALWLAGALPGLAQQGLVPVPELTSRVTDLTRTLTPDQSSALEAKLGAFEQSKGAQVAVLIVPTTKPEEI